jgi:hypothetical protein
MTVGDDGLVRIWETMTGKELGHFEGWAGPLAAAAFSRDADLLAVAGTSDKVSLLETTTGKLRQSFAGEGAVASICFAADGRTLAVVRADGTVQVWEVAGSRELPRPAGEATATKGAALSADGQKLACFGNTQVWVCDVSTGEVLVRLWDKDRTITCVTFSPDDTTLAVANAAGTVSLWETVTGKERARIQGPPTPLLSTAFLPAGDYVAAADRDMTIHVWSLAKGKEVLQCASSQGGPATCVAFSPTGSALAAGGADTSALCWRIAEWNKAVSPATGSLSLGQWQDYQEALAGGDAGKAYQAIWALAGQRQVTGSMLAALQPVRFLAPGEIDRLLANLASAHPAVADLAMEELEELAEPVIPHVRLALQKNPSPEVKGRLEQLLGRLDGRTPSARQLQDWRGIEVLEHSNAAEARQKLAALAEGNPAAARTRRARAALERRNQLILAGLIEK